MSQRRRARIKKEDRCPALQCGNLSNETYTSRTIKNKLAICLTKQTPPKKEKALKKPREKRNSRKFKKSEITEKLCPALNAPVCHISPSDSDLLVISEADSGSSAKITPSSDYRNSSTCNDSVIAQNNNLFSELQYNSVPIVTYTSKISVSLNECILETSKNNETLSYGPSFVEATLPNSEIHHENDFSDLIEFFPNIMQDRCQQIIPEDYNLLQNVAVPNCLSPKRRFLSIMNHFNSFSGSKENAICNRFKIMPVIKPPGYSYEESNFTDLIAHLAILKAANNHLKERSKSQYFSSFVPVVSNSVWHKSVLNFHAEDNDSEISISSCKTSDIQPEFFDFSFAENPETFPVGNLSDCFLSPSLTSDKNNDLYNTCSINEEIADSLELLKGSNTLSEANNSVLLETDSGNIFTETNSDNNVLPVTEAYFSLPETKPKAKRKRQKRCIWEPRRKRRCKKKEKDLVSKINTELNTENTISKLNNELITEAFCDTCDESEGEDDIPLQFLNPNGFQRKETSSEIDINHDDNLYIMKDPDENESHDNQVIKSSAVNQLQSVLQEKENSFVMENLNFEKSVEQNSEKPVVKKKRRRIWGTKKRRCKNKKTDSTSELNNDLNSGNIVPELSSELNAEALCDTCDESEAEDDILLQILNPNDSQRKETSSEIDINRDNLFFMKDLYENEAHDNQVLKSSAVNQLQSVLQEKENSCVIENLNFEKSVEQNSEKPVVKKKRRGGVWCTKKRRCTNKKTDLISEENNDLSSGNIVPELSSELNAEALCDTCDESEAEDDILLQNLNPNDSQRKETSSEIDINRDDNLYVIKDIDENETPGNPIIKSSATKELKSALCEKESSCILENLNLEKSVEQNSEKPVAKKKRKVIWGTKRRRCKNKNKDLVSELNNDLNSENIISELSSQLNAEALCDTCDESEVEDDTPFDFLNPSSSQRIENSSKIDVYQSNQNVIKNSKESVASCNQFMNLSDTKHCHSAQHEKENACIDENTSLKNSVEGRDSVDTSMNEELCVDLQEKNHCNTSNKLNDCSLLFTDNFSNENSNISMKSNKRKIINFSGSRVKKSFESHKTIAECEPSTELHSPKSKKKKLQISDFQSKKKLKYSLDLNASSQSHEIPSKSNHSLQNHPEISLSSDKSPKSIYGTNNRICNLQVSVQKLDDAIVAKYLEIASNELSKNKSDFGNIFQENSENISNICENFTQGQNSDLISDNFLYSEPSLSVENHTKSNNSILDQENSDMLTTDDSLNNTVIDAYIENCGNANEIIHAVNIYSESPAVKCSVIEPSKEHLIKENISHTALESVNTSDGDIASVFSENISGLELQENEHINDQFPKRKDTLLEKYCEETGTGDFSRDKLNFENSTQFQNSDLISGKSLFLEPSHSVKNHAKSNVFNPISDQENSDMLTTEDTSNNAVNTGVCIKNCGNTKTITHAVNNSPKNSAVECVGTELSTKHLSKVNISERASGNKSSSADVIKSNIPDLVLQENKHMNDHSSEKKSASNIELINFNLIDDDLDFELDQQEELETDNNSSNTSDSKFHNDQNQNSFETFPFSSAIHDHLNKIDCNINEIDYNVNNKNKPPNSSNAVQQEVGYSSLDDDSDSDKEYNFKRSHERSTNLAKEYLKHEPLTRIPDENNALAITTDHLELSLPIEDQSNYKSKNDVVTNSTNSSKVTPETPLSLTNVVDQIIDYCSKKQGLEAVEFSHQFICITPSPDAAKEIFKNLLSGLFSFVVNSTNSEDSLSEIFDHVLKLMHKFEIYDRKMLSCFIIKCHEHPKLNSYVEEIFVFFQKKSLPLKNKAIKAFVSVLKTEKLDIDVLLGHINYIKSVCKKKIPKNLMHSALELSQTAKSLQQSKEIYRKMHEVCNILKVINRTEVNKLYLKEFLHTCFKKSMFANIAELFVIWSAKKMDYLLWCIFLALESEPEFMGTYYEKLALAISNNEDANETLDVQKIWFSQFGIALMLCAFYQKYWDSAFKILDVLHRYNVNYYDLVHFCKFDLPPSYSDADTRDMKIRPYLVVFVAVDIMLHFEEADQAFIIFQDFSWLTPEENLDEGSKRHVLKERYHRLMKLVPLLNSKGSVIKAWEAFKLLVTAVEQGLVEESLEDEKDKDTDQTKEKTPIQCIHEMYNEILIGLINCNQLSYALDLYELSVGRRKDIFTLQPIVIRGLAVALYNNENGDSAESVFHHGILNDVYPNEKLELSSTPWKLTLKSEWMVPEIRFVLGCFIRTLSPLLSDKPKDTNFEKWFSVKINFEITQLQKSKVSCLDETGLDPKYYISKTKSALQSMVPSLQCIDAIGDEEALIVTSESLYNYWKTVYAADLPAISNFKMSRLLRQKHKRFTFGEINTSSEKETSLLDDKDSPKSPKVHQTQATECLVADYIDKIRFSSSTEILPPVTKEASPGKKQRNISNKSPVTSFVSEKETENVYKDMQGPSKNLSTSIIQIRKPKKSIDMFDKGYETLNDSLVDHNFDNKSGPTTNKNTSPSIFPKNLNIEKKFNVSNIQSSTPNLKHAARVRTNSVNNKIRKSNKKVSLGKSKLSPNSGKINVTVSFDNNSSSTRSIVCDSPKNVKRNSNSLQNSKLLVKKFPRDPAVKVPSSDVMTKMNQLNKLNVKSKKVNGVISFNEGTTNANLMDELKEKPLTVTINRFSNQKITSLVSHKDSGKATSTISSIAAKPVISRTFTLQDPDSDTNEKISSTKESIVISNINSLQCKNSPSSRKNNDSETVVSGEIHVNKHLTNKNDKANTVLTTTEISSADVRSKDNTIIFDDSLQCKNIKKSIIAPDKNIIKLVPTSSTSSSQAVIKNKNSTIIFDDSLQSKNTTKLIISPEKNKIKFVPTSASSTQSDVKQNRTIVFDNSLQSKNTKKPIISPEENRIKLVPSSASQTNLKNKDSSKFFDNSLQSKNSIISPEKNKIKLVPTSASQTDFKNRNSAKFFDNYLQSKNTEKPIISPEKNKMRLVPTIASQPEKKNMDSAKNFDNSLLSKNTKPIISPEKNKIKLIPTSASQTDFKNRDSAKFFDNSKQSENTEKPIISPEKKTIKLVPTSASQPDLKNKNSAKNFDNSLLSKNTKPIISPEKNRIKLVPSSNFQAVSFPRKYNATATASELTQQKILYNARASKLFSGDNCRPEEFQKIKNYIKIKISQRNKDLSLEQQDQRALALAKDFIKINDSITVLDKRTMKLLMEFVEKTNV